MRETEENSEPQEHPKNLPEGAEVVEVMETNVLTKTVSGNTVATENSNYHEHSKNLLTSEAGEALRWKTHRRIVEVNSNTDLQKKASEYRECSQNSRSGEVVVTVGRTDEVSALMVNKDM